MENWKPIEGYEGYYEVSDEGRVRSLDRVIHKKNGQKVLIKSQLMKPIEHSLKYLLVTLHKDNIHNTQKIHQLVAKAFLGDLSDGMNMVVCHNDGNTYNNKVENLRWDTTKSNASDRKKHGTEYQLDKTHCPLGAPLEGRNLKPDLLKKGRRGCVACSRFYSWAKYYDYISPKQKQEIHDLCYKYDCGPGKLKTNGIYVLEKADADS